MMRGALFSCACFALLVGVAAGSQLEAGAEAMRQSDVALALGRGREAVVCARRAAESVVPGSPYAARAYERLLAVAMAAEVEGRFDDAAFAWRAMREAAEATRPAPAGAGKIAVAEAGMARVALASSAHLAERR